MSNEQYRLYEAGEKTDIFPDFGASIAEATHMIMVREKELRPWKPVSLIKIQNKIKYPNNSGSI